MSNYWNIIKDPNNTLPTSEAFKSTKTSDFQPIEARPASRAVPAGFRGSLATAISRSPVGTKSDDPRLQFESHFRSTYGIRPAAYDASSQVWLGNHHVAETYRSPHGTRSVSTPRASLYRPWTTESRSQFMQPQAKRDQISGLTSTFSTGPLLTSTAGSTRRYSGNVHAF